LVLSDLSPFQDPNAKLENRTLYYTFIPCCGASRLRILVLIHLTLFSFQLDREKIIIGTRRHQLISIPLSSHESLETLSCLNPSVIYNSSEHETAITSLAFSSTDEGPTFVSGDQDGRIVLWNKYSGNIFEETQAHDRGISGLLVSNSREVISVGFDKKICVYQVTENVVEEEEEPFVLEYPAKTKGAGRFGKLKKIVSKVKKEHAVQISQFKSKIGIKESKKHPVEKTENRGSSEYSLNQRLEWTGHEQDIYHLALLDDDKKLATASLDHSIKIWDLSDGSNVQTLVGHSDIVSSLCESDGFIFSSSLDQTIKQWDWKSGRLVHTFSQSTTGWIKTVGVLGDLLVSGNFSGDIEVEA
jgi:WD40 repeat protein